MSPVILAYEDKHLTVNVMPNGTVVLSIWETDDPNCSKCKQHELDKLDAQEMAIAMLDSIREWEKELKKKKKKIIDPGEEDD